MVACVLSAMRLVPPCLHAAFHGRSDRVSDAFVRFVRYIAIHVVHCLSVWTLAKLSDTKLAPHGSLDPPMHDAAAMFDGHGGSAAAQYLAKNLHSMILPKLRSQLAKESTFSRQLSKQAGLSQPAELSELFVQAFHEADKEVMSALDGEMPPYPCCAAPSMRVCKQEHPIMPVKCHSSVAKGSHCR